MTAEGAGWVLIVGPNWVGDMVIAQGLFKTLKLRQPETIIDVVAPRWSIPLLERMPEVNQAIDLNVQHGELALRRRYRLARRLRKQGYDWSIVLPRSFKSALVPWFARVPRRSGYLGESRYGLLNEIHALDQARTSLLVQHYAALAYPPDQLQVPEDIPSPRLNVDEARRQELIERLGLSLDRPIIIFAPGAQYGSAKQWPGEYFAQLARRLKEKGFRIWVMGSGQDVEICRDITRVAGDDATLNLCKQTSLQEAIDLMSLADAVVTNDSGLMHIAAALERPMVAIFGSSTPDYTPPLGAKQHTRIMHLDLDCSPCFKRQCPLGHLNCLRQIGVDNVFEAVRALV
ncbi:MAG: lipopolysaccharide heptosyltransferase II [Gammaproteobacteria bacterium]|nr:lipopolysaccharide heptosyltransferase II [Gammaproteobacteria bacterium]